MISNYLVVNETTYTVMYFNIQLGKRRGDEDTRFGNVPDICGLYYVLNDELLKGLVLGHTEYK